MYMATLLMPTGSQRVGAGGGERIGVYTACAWPHACSHSVLAFYVSLI